MDPMGQVLSWSKLYAEGGQESFHLISDAGALTLITSKQVRERHTPPTTNYILTSFSLMLCPFSHLILE